MADVYREKLKRALEEALWDLGQADPDHILAEWRREGFERRFLERRLATLCQKWQAGAIAQFTFQKMALAIHGMLGEMEKKDPPPLPGATRQGISLPG